MRVMHGDRGHQPVEGQHAGVVGHYQARAGVGEMLDAADLYPEPRVEEEPEQRPHDRIVEVRVEAELVDAVVTGEPVPHKVGDRSDPLRELVARLFPTGSTGTATVLIDFAYDGGDLVGGRAGVGFGEERGMLARTLRALPGTPLSRRTTRIPVQRNDFRL